MFALYETLARIVTVICLIVAFPAIMRLFFELCAQGWQDWKYLFSRKRKPGTST
jgi:hypothetical protein